MKKTKYYFIPILILVSCVMILLGMSSSTSLNKNENIEEVSEFKIKESKNGTVWVHNLYGIENKVGFIEKPLVAKQEQSYDWFFWGDREEILNKSLQIIAVNVANKQKIKLANIDKLKEYDKPIFSLNKGYEIKQMSSLLEGKSNLKNNDMSNKLNPVAHYAFKMNFPETGLWEISVLVAGKTYSAFEVRVLSTSSGIKNLD
ncbi:MULTISPECIES: hypothetical protein [Bacillus cereus group]|uniref:hypothetical protein n=1 Tax=Bacillus cereus group TaxID=86661 RepID=UPI00099414C6|nr:MULTISPECIES: hypothetical protein [Bacillus cereus group]MED1436327.1 hypothetical protein [Bacillus mycoides]OOQ91982.1 hypothetical protein BW898_26330 [Bacillus cereus]